MASPNKYPQSPEVIEPEIRPQDTIESFETTNGSIYTYDGLGHTQRLKATTGEIKEPQDIAVFVNLDTAMKEDVLDAIRPGHLPGTKVYVVERQTDNSPRVIRAIEQVQNPGALHLAIYRQGQVAEVTPASLFPHIGASVFDARHYPEGDVWKTERHLGHEVTRITER